MRRTSAELREVVSKRSVEASPPDAPDVVRACVKMTAAGIAVAVLPYALLAGLFVGISLWAGRPMLGEDDVTGMARVMLLCTLGAGLVVLGSGLRAGWQVRALIGSHGRIGRWLAIAAATPVLWCLPPFGFVTTLWMFVGVSLATRPLWWAAASSGPLDEDDARTHLRYALAIAAGIAVLSHVAAWTTVLAATRVVPPEEFARVEAIRRGEPVERREWEVEQATQGSWAGGIDFISFVTGGGAVAAGRYVGGDMSPFQFALGYWPELAQAWIAPAPEGPTDTESWSIAALAFTMSLAFWLPWMLAWTWLGRGRATQLPATR